MRTLILVIAMLVMGGCGRGLGVDPSNDARTVDASVDAAGPACGDGRLDPGETCDDGNRTSGDGCSDDCRSDETCGNGVADPDEECDAGEGNSDGPGAACRPDCRLGGCGDGILDPGEGCDEGAENSAAPDAACRPDCRPARCGDDIRDASRGEACDGADTGPVDCADLGQGLLGNPPECTPDCETDPSVCLGAFQVSTGAGHTCVLLSDHTPRCFGWNSEGQLGDGTVIDRSTPVPVMGLTSIVAISGGYHTSCAVDAGHSAWCWGANHDGQLGDGTNTDRLTPGPVAALTDVRSVSVATQHACAVTGDGTAWCWGDNYYGALGDGSFTESTVPVPVEGLSGVRSIVAGAGSPGNFTCAVLDDGTVWCWGSNVQGELGNPALDWRYPSPSPVEGLTGVVHLAASIDSCNGYSSHVCVAHADGMVSCWGQNDRGQLGNGTRDPSLAPTTVSGLVDAVQVATGDLHSCALRADGTVVCWGENGGGMVGDGTLEPRLQPTTVIGLTDTVSFAAGGHHTCAVRRDGTVWCWGSNLSGELGNGDSDWSEWSPMKTVGW